MNIVQLTERLKSMPQEQIVSYAQGQGGGEVPQYLAVSELSRRKSEAARLAAAQNPQKPQTTVVDDVVAAAGVPQQGIGQIARAMAPQTDMTNNTARMLNDQGITRGMQDHKMVHESEDMEMDRRMRIPPGLARPRETYNMAVGGRVMQPTQMMAEGGRVSASGIFYDEYGLPRFRVPPSRPEYGPKVDRSAPSMRSVSPTGDGRPVTPSTDRDPRAGIAALPSAPTATTGAPRVSPEIADYMVGGEGFYNETLLGDMYDAEPMNRTMGNRMMRAGFDPMISLPPAPTPGTRPSSLPEMGGPRAPQGWQGIRPNMAERGLLGSEQFDDEDTAMAMSVLQPPTPAAPQGRKGEPPIEQLRRGVSPQDVVPYPPVQGPPMPPQDDGPESPQTDPNILTEPVPEDPTKDPDARRAVSGGTGNAITSSLAQMGGPAGEFDDDDIQRQFAQDKWMALARTGFAMMASKNPTVLGALGEAGMYGMDAFDAAIDRRDEALAAAKDDAMEERLFGLKEAQLRASMAKGSGSAGRSLDPTDLINRERYLREALTEAETMLQAAPSPAAIQNYEGLKAELDTTSALLRSYYGVPQRPQASAPVFDVTGG